jgi:Asp-tRNA(Asn)/Glu-tRNA(Gln) amidotransferase C subunit
MLRHAVLTLTPPAAAAVRFAPPRPAPAPRATPRTFAAAADGAQSPPPPDIQKLAAMSRLDVTDAQAAAWSPKINAIVDWCAFLPASGVLRVAAAVSAPTTLMRACVRPPAASTRRFGQLRGVELGGVEPSLRAPTADGAAGASEASDALTSARPDAPVDFAAREDMLASVPKRQAPFIYIPRIATTDDSA